MFLKSRITREEYEALEDGVKGFYKEINGKFVLQTDDAEELREAARLAREERDNLKQRLEAIQADIDAAKTAEEAAREEAARKAKDLPAIEASWQAKLDKQKETSDNEIERLRKLLRNNLIDKEAQALANKISTMPTLIAPLLAARMVAELDGDVAITRVLDKDGKPSALSLDELAQEFVAIPEYADIMKGSKGGGGGAAHHPGAGGAGTGKTFQELTEQERVALHRNDPAEYRRLRDNA